MVRFLALRPKVPKKEARQEKPLLAEMANIVSLMLILFNFTLLAILLLIVAYDYA